MQNQSGLVYMDPDAAMAEVPDSDVDDEGYQSNPGTGIEKDVTQREVGLVGLRSPY